MNNTFCYSHEKLEGGILIKQVRSWSKPKIKNLIGCKKVDWSIFEYGTTIPVEFYEDFANANGNRMLEIGERVQIELHIYGKTYEASLVYKKRNDSTAGALQILFSQELKELLKNIFATSYNYLLENREEKQKSSVDVPDELAEYIEFYQTNTPFSYHLTLINKKNPSNTSFWWVNQGKTYKQEKDGEYLWAPKANRAGYPVPHHVSLLKAKHGDVIFCYSEKELKSIGIVQSKAIESQKPSEIKSDDWQKDGYLLKVKYYDFQPSIDKNEIPIEWRKNDQGTFDINGNIKQGYFFELSHDFARKIFERFFDRFPTEVKEKFGEYKIRFEHSSVIKEQDNLADQFILSYKDLITHIHKYISSKGFYFTLDEVKNLFLCIKSKPFVILSGISGTGKTKIIQLFAESIGANEKNKQFTLIPIRPDWNDGSDLLGYKDIKGDFIEGPFTKVVKIATENPDKPYFVLLDEMNLARVEYYFSDILSVMESRKWGENGKIVSSKLLTKETAGYDLQLPNNLYIIGTVNMDETTYPFSKKVLDRANTIEFNHVDLGNVTFFQELEEIDHITISNEKLSSTYLHLKDVYTRYKDIVEKAVDELKNINNALEPMYAHVGYRVRDEICFYLAYNQEMNLFSFEKALDYCILQKILPRISGSDSRVDQGLKNLYKIFTNREYDESEDQFYDIGKIAKYPLSAAKVAEMLRRLSYDGFTSFWIS